MTIRDYRYVVNDDDKVFKISFDGDVSVSNIVLSFPNLDKISNIYKEQVFRADTSIFMDKNNGAFIIRYPDKSMTLVFGNKTLNVSFDKKGFLFTDGDKWYDFDTLSRENKYALFSNVTGFMEEFNTINEYLPTYATKTFIFLQMGILNINDVTIVSDGNGVLLYLNSFRSLNMSKLKLNVADSQTFEVVGSIDASIGKHDEDNFSYRGNVSYHISDDYTGCGYATKALAEFVSYVNTLSDEYNREIYIAALVDDIAYQTVALKNGAKLHYDGDVPDGDSLSTLNKIRQIKIYKIGNK